MKTALVCGAGGFIGSHLVKRLKEEGFWVRGVDLKYPDFGETEADDFIIGDLRKLEVCERAFRNNKGLIFYDEVYQLAADMGGAGYIFTGDHDAYIMHNSALINLNIVELCRLYRARNIFYSSSACIYPLYNQLDPDNPKCDEASAYPADPDSEYGWEKLFSEHLYRSYARNHDMNIHIARFHNIYGPEGTWTGGKEKAPAAICRKVSEATPHGPGLSCAVEVWGSGKQTRSFLYIDECLEGMRRLMDSTVTEVVNIGSEEMISINGLTNLVASIADKKISIYNIDGPEGVQGRNSDNKLIQELLGWAPSATLVEGLTKTYHWINSQVNAVEAVA